MRTQRAVTDIVSWFLREGGKHKRGRVGEVGGSGRRGEGEWRGEEVGQREEGLID